MHNYMNICTLLYTFCVVFPCYLWRELCHFKSWNRIPKTELVEHIWTYCRCLLYYPDISLGLPGHKTFKRSLINFSCKHPVIADRSAFRAERNWVLGCQHKNTLEKVCLSASFQRRKPSAIKSSVFRHSGMWINNYCCSNSVYFSKDRSLLSHQLSDLTWVLLVCPLLITLM